MPVEEFVSKSVLFHVFSKEMVGKSDISLGQMHIELKHVDLTEPVTKWCPLTDLVSNSAA